MVVSIYIQHTTIPNIKEARRSKSYLSLELIEEDESLDEIVEKFDLTTASTNALFETFDSDGDQIMSHEEFRVALAQQDLFAEKVPESDKNFQRLLAYVDVNNDGQISKEEYAMCLQKLKLASLYLTKKMKTKRNDF